MKIELVARVKIWQLEELKVFNSLRLSVVVLAEVLPEVFADVAGRTELVRTELVETEFV